MKKTLSLPYRVILKISLALLCLVIAGVSAAPDQAIAQQVPTPPEPLVAIHVSELTQALETMPAVPPTPTDTGYQWWYTSWHYFVAYESLQEALRADGTPFVVVTDSDIAAGKLLQADGSPRYPILISLAAEAVADNEIAPLRDYVSAGGFLFVGSSAFTRNPDGTTRGDFALANEMGLHTGNPDLLYWFTNNHFTKTADHRLTNHIPSGALDWWAPLTAEEIPTGVSPTRVLHSNHYTWQVVAGGATVLANGDPGPLLTVNNYGKGEFIYHGAFQPLIGHGEYDPGMYAYLIFRKAIEWAFESFSLPILKVSPWPYQYDAAFVVRHDFENTPSLIQSIESSAQFEHSLGVKGDYFFCTGALREDMGGDAATVASLRNAVSAYGATIGSHNGGLKNPVNASLLGTDFDYWHWGPDEALDTVQPGYPLASSPPGYSSGKAYAYESIKISFQDIEGWLAGVDNGRAGCGAAHTCPRFWGAPYSNSTRDDSDDILDQLGAVVMGEQKIGPFPHKTLSYKTPGKYYSPLSLPVSDWYVGTTIPKSVDEQTVESMHSAVDFYYSIGAFINFYGHTPSNNGSVEQEYVTYAASKPGIWKTNSIGIYDWWTARSNIAIAPAFSMTGSIASIQATITGSTDASSSVEIVIPNWINLAQYNIRVLCNNLPADPGDYRLTDNGVKVRVGTSISSVEVRYVPAALSSLSVSPASVLGGAASQGTVTLSGPAPGNGVAVSLSSDTPSAAGVPALVTVPAGSTSAAFTISTYPIAGSTSVTITADDGLNQKTAALTVTPPVLNSLSLSPASVLGGAASLGTVTLSGPAPVGGAAISLSSDTPSAAGVPSTVTVPAGSTSATFTATTFPVVSSTPATISAVFSGVTKTATLTVDPAALSTLSVNPASVLGGIISQGTVTLSGPAPIGGVAVSLSSDTPSAAGVPALVTVLAGSASAAFTITTYPVVSSTPVAISADYSGVTKTITLTVTPSAVSSLLVSPASVLGGIISQGTVTLTGAAPSGGVAVSLSSNTPLAAGVPSTVTVPAGSASAAFTITTYPVASSTPVTISADYGGILTAVLTVTPPALNSLSVSPTSVLGGATSQGTVTLTGPAPSGGVAISLSSGVPSAAGVPSTVTVPAGSASATFTITTYPVASSTPVTISATYGGILTATLTVTPPALNSFTVSPTSVAGGTSSGGTVTLSGPAPSGGVAISLSSSGPSAAGVPSTVTVPAGSASATFTITTYPVASSTPVTISATYGGILTAALTVTPPALNSFSVSPTSVAGGTSSGGTVTLSGPAPAGGMAISLNSSDPSAAGVPDTVTVPAGSASAAFTVTTYPVASSTFATITAVYSGVARTAMLTITPPVVKSLSVNPTSVLGRIISQGTVTLSGPAPAGGAAVALSSSDPSAAGVPATVTVPAGSTSAAFTVTTYAVAGSTPVTISATYGSILTAALTVNPADGDFYGDGVKVEDALKALRIAAALDTPTAIDFAHGDVAPLVNSRSHPDGKIDINDVIAILRKAVGLPGW